MKNKGPPQLKQRRRGEGVFQENWEREERGNQVSKVI